MLHTVSLALLVASFVGAGLINAVGTAAAKRDFVRWGYPHWWGHITGALELFSAVLIALPVSRFAGLTLGAAIIAAAGFTILRNRDFLHLVPLGVFIGLIALAAYNP